MSSKSKIAAVALIISAFASPVFAAQGVGADPITDGRYSPELMLNVTKRAPVQHRTIRTHAEDNVLNERLAIGHN
jgi:hypothetical protein